MTFTKWNKRRKKTDMTVVSLDQNIFDDVTVYVGQAEIPALVPVGESFVVDSQSVQNRRL